jgi:general secretion pathway protein M
MNGMKIWQDFWRARAPREQLGIALALAAVVATLLWWLALAPALQTLRNSAAQAAKLEAQLQTLRGLQAQAQALQAQPKMARDEALRALEASVKQRLGASAQLSVQGDRVSLLLKGTSADALAQWLAQARVNARALPVEARLQRSASAPVSPATWDGSVVLALPAR